MTTHRTFRLPIIAAVSALLAAPAFAQAVDPSRDASRVVALSTGFSPDPTEFTVNAGGRVDVSSASQGCVGLVSERANVTLNYLGGEGPLAITADAFDDTTLAVLAPDGSWHCNDDSDGADPAVRFDAPASGRYQIWVGTYNQSMTQATLRISGAPAPPN